MFHNMLVTGLAPLNGKNEFLPWNNSAFVTPETNSQEISKSETAKLIKKKLKRNRTSFSWEQLRILESTFQRTPYIDGHRRQELAQKLKIGDKCIKIWFQNRRMKKKRQSSESSDTSTDASVTSTSPALQVSPVPDKMPNIGYVLPNNPGYIPIETPQLTHYETAFGYDNLYPTQYYPNNITAYHNPVQNETFQNYNSFWGTNLYDFNI